MRKPLRFRISATKSAAFSCGGPLQLAEQEFLFRAAIAFTGTRVSESELEAGNLQQVPRGLCHHRKTCFVRTSAPVIGSWISGGLGALGLTLPSYIGAMLVGAPIRNVDDHLGWFGLSPRSIEVIGNAALSLFLVVALMDLHLDLAGAGHAAAWSASARKRSWSWRSAAGRCCA